MTLLEAIVLGLVQGLTEFLPISSTAHLRIVPALLGWSDPGAAYSAVIQLGTVAAVLAYFRKDIVRLLRGFLRGLVDRAPFGTEDSRLAWFVGLGTIPIVVAGVAFKSAIKTSLRSLYVISASLIILAVILFLVERLAAHKRTLAELTLKDGLVIGLWQALALIPGCSRSGTTITGGLFLGLRREDAARYSFLLSIPATTAAGLYELKDFFSAAARPSTTALVAGTAVSFVTGLMAISGLLHFVRTRTMLAFVVYRIALGALLLGLLGAGVLKPGEEQSTSKEKEKVGMMRQQQSRPAPSTAPSPAEYFERLRQHLRHSPSKSFEAAGLKLREAAVLAPLFWRGGEPWVYLTQRPLTLRSHPGQISFPGGKREQSDVTLLHTALRETREELGIASEVVDVLGVLGAMPTISAYWVTPFVGVVPEDVELAPDPVEIDEVIAAPLWRLRRERRHLLHADRDVFTWDDGRHVVWGVTWRMLDQLLGHVHSLGQ